MEFWFEIGKMLFFQTLVVIWSQVGGSGPQCQSFSTNNFYCKNVNYNQTLFPHDILETKGIRTQVSIELYLVAWLRNTNIDISYVIY